MVQTQQAVPDYSSPPKKVIRQGSFNINFSPPSLSVRRSFCSLSLEALVDPRRFLGRAIMSLIKRLFLVFLASLIVTFAGLCFGQAPQPSDAEYLAGVREKTWQMIYEVERLQDDIVAELSDRKERDLYRQADALLALLLRFESALRSKVSRDDLAKNFDQMDQKVHELLQAVQALAPEQRAIQRSAEHLRALDEQLHYSLFSSADSRERAQQIMERQAQALEAEARELETIARYVLAKSPGKGAIEGDLNKFVNAVERFRKSLAAKVSQDQLRHEFTAINEIWAQVTRGLKELPPGQNAHFLRSAGEVDRLHERLFRLLGIKGKRPQLILGA
jgi:hypothetical protein